MALIVSVVSVVAAYPIAYYLALVATKRKYVLLLLILAPFLVSYFLRILAWKVILGDQGVINSFLYWTGLRAEGDPVTGSSTASSRSSSRSIYVYVPVRGAPDLRLARDRSTAACSRRPPTWAPAAGRPSAG